MIILHHMQYLHSAGSALYDTVSGGVPGLALHYIGFHMMRTVLWGCKQPAALAAAAGCS
jgi:hypothetical protein